MVNHGIRYVLEMNEDTEGARERHLEDKVESKITPAIYRTCTRVVSWRLSCGIYDRGKATCWPRLSSYPIAP